MLVLDLILIALTISINPLPLAAFILILSSKNGTKKGAMYVLGWFISLALFTALTILVTGNQPPASSSAQSTAVTIVKIVLGLLLIAVGIRQRRQLGRPKPPKKTPKWEAGVDSMRMWFAMSLGFLLQPWVLVTAGLATIVGAHVGNWVDALVLVLFCVLSSWTYISILLYAALRPAKAAATLTNLRHWMDTHTDQLVIYGALGLGLYLVVKSVAVLLT